MSKIMSNQRIHESANQSTTQYSVQGSNALQVRENRTAYYQTKAPIIPVITDHGNRRRNTSLQYLKAKLSRFYLVYIQPGKLYNGHSKENFAGREYRHFSKSESILAYSLLIVFALCTVFFGL